VTFESSTLPPEMVLATAVDRNAPTMFSTAEIATAIFGRRAPVAIEVAIALAGSWKPLLKSKASAVTITRITRVLIDARRTGCGQDTDHRRWAGERRVALRELRICYA